MSTYDELDEAIKAWEERLTSGEAKALELNMVDRIKPMTHTPDHLRHKGISISVPTTLQDNTERGRVRYRLVDTVVVELQYRVPPMDQRGGRLDSLALERKMRRLLTDRTWEPNLHVKYQSSQRSVHPLSSDWYVTTLTFQQSRYELTAEET